MLVQMVQHEVPVKLRVNVKTRFPNEGRGKTFNVPAELPGTDAAVRHAEFQAPPRRPIENTPRPKARPT